MDCFVSGSFDLLHSGHVEFLQQAARFGRLHVAVGSDRTVLELKGRPPVYTEQERVFMVSALACVHSAFVSKGSGVLDFEGQLRALRPDIFVVNEDGTNSAKAKLCADLGIDYQILKREPHAGLPRRSTSALRTRHDVPYRIDLAGGWLDQPFVSKYCPGSVVTVCIEPTMEFDERSGLATSTRRVAIELWNSIALSEDHEAVARVLFAVENPPGKEPIAGSQDAIGIAFPGFAKSDYSGSYWPDRVTHKRDASVAQFVDDHIRLVPLGPRAGEYDVLSDTDIDAAGARRLAVAADRCWEALLDRNLSGFGAAVRASFDAQIAMFPHMVNGDIRRTLRQYEGYFVRLEAVWRGRGRVYHVGYGRAGRRQHSDCRPPVTDRCRSVRRTASVADRVSAISILAAVDLPMLPEMLARDPSIGMVLSGSKPVDYYVRRVHPWMRVVRVDSQRCRLPLSLLLGCWAGRRIGHRTVPDNWSHPTTAPPSWRRSDGTA